MSEERALYNGAMSAPAQSPDGTRLLPRRESKGMLPSTWLERSVRLEYAGADGKRTETTAVLLDCFPVGPVLRIAGSRTVIPWERLVLLELEED